MGSRQRGSSTTLNSVCRLIAAMTALVFVPVVLAEDAYFETGSVIVSGSIDAGNWETVTLRETYSNPVVIVGPVSHDNDLSLSARVRNVTPAGFQVGVQSPCESAGASAPGVQCPPPGGWQAEAIRYWVVEEGIWEFPDGTLLEAGRLSTSTVRSAAGYSGAVDTVTFQQAFSSSPVVLHAVNTFNDSGWITSSSWGSGSDTRLRPGASAMSLALEGAEVVSGHGAEVIGWVAVEPAVGVNNGRPYVAGHSAGRDVDRDEDECQGYPLGGFAAAPDVVVSHNTMAGGNGGWVRFCGGELSPSGFSVHIDEDQVNDSERTGLEEAVSWFAFEANSSGRLIRPTTFCSGVTALFCDDFDSGTLAGDGWTVDPFRGGQAGIGGQTSNSGNLSLFTSSGGVSVTSPGFDLSGSTSGSLEYWWRRGDDAFSENPDRNEDLVVEFLDDRNRWIEIESLAGDGTPGQSGATQFELPSGAFHSAFQFRFQQQRGSGDGYDFWHIDDVVLRALSFTCEPDQFNRSGLGPDWVTTRSSGNFTPQIVSGRLRLTEAVGNQATAATYQRLFPGADNLIQIEFDYYAYGGTGADGLAVVFSDASVTPQAGGYGGSLGYAQEPDGSGGFSGGWLGIGLDEYGNFSNNNEGRVGGNTGRTLDSVAVRGSAPDYAYIADSGGLSPGIDSNNDNNPYRYRITIDSRGGKTPELTVERNGRGTGNTFQTLIQETLSGQPEIPENLFLSLTGSTGGSTNIHELDNLQVCADKIGAVQALVDHFELEHSGSGLTCQPAEVTIRACGNADCSQLFPDPVEVTMAPSTWVGGDTFTLNGAATRALRVTSPATVTLGVPGSDPGTIAFSQTLCDNGTGGLAPDKCDLTFFDTGFDISVPDHVSDTVVSASIAAVRKDNVSEQCVPAFSNETKAVALWSSYVNPASGTLDLFVEGNPVPGSPGATSSLGFDANGVATADIRYPDVGRLRLNARYQGSGDDAGLVMSGDGTFVVRPDHFELHVPGNPAATSVQDGNTFVAAGTDFEIWVSSVNASGNVTPNFGRETPAEAVELDASLVAPAGGDSPALSGALGSFGEDCSGASAPGGTACGRFQWPEVGIIRITPSLTSGNYLGTADVVGDPLSYVGRFIPDRFRVTVSERGEVKPFCESSTAFAYTGQSLSWRSGLEPLLTLEPLNSNGEVTQNYTLGDFQRLSVGGLSRLPGSSDRSALDTDGNPLSVSASLSTPPALTIVAPGQLQYLFSSSDQLVYEKNVQSRIPPFSPDYRIELSQLVDADGVSSPQLPVAIDPVFPLEMRYGRLQLENAYGPETSGLEIPFGAYYFTVAGFIPNIADSCWTYATGTDVALDQTALTGGSTSVVGVSDSLTAGAPPAGSGLVLSAPGEGNRGNVPVTFSVPLWLTGDFDGDGTLEAPSALATFGVYRGHDRVIYWREVR